MGYIKGGYSRFRSRRLLPALWAVILLGGMSSCRKDNIVKRNLLADYEVQSYADMFQVLWKGINTNYVYWAQDPLNWDSIYTVFRPRFDSVDKVATTDQNAAQNLAFQYMVDMTKDLKDGNFVLQLNGGGDYIFADSSYKSMISFIPKLMLAARTNPVLPDTLFDYIIHNNYLDDFDYGQYLDLNTLGICQTISGTVSKGARNIQYLGVNTFNLKAAYYTDYSSRPIRPVLKNFFSAIKQPACDGFILDLRNNRGGDVEDIDFFVGQMTTSPLLYAFARYKSGPGRLDYTPSMPMYVTPQQGAADFKKKIVILTDAYTASLSEKVIMALKALPGATVVTIGATTYGSCGLITTNGIATNSGGFAISSYGGVNLSNMAVQDAKGHFTMTGIVPDVPVTYDTTHVSQMLKTGVDIQMEAAVRYLNQ
jgi:hypothetical protein